MANKTHVQKKALVLHGFKRKTLPEIDESERMVLAIIPSLIFLCKTIQELAVATMAVKIQSIVSPPGLGRLILAQACASRVATDQNF